jgi:hypothetical protein
MATYLMLVWVLVASQRDRRLPLRTFRKSCLTARCLLAHTQNARLLEPAKNLFCAAILFAKLRFAVVNISRLAGRLVCDLARFPGALLGGLDGSAASRGKSQLPQ